MRVYWYPNFLFRLSTSEDELNVGVLGLDDVVLCTSVLTMRGTKRSPLSNPITMES